MAPTTLYVRILRARKLPPGLHGCMLTFAIKKTLCKVRVVDLEKVDETIKLSFLCDSLSASPDIVVTLSGLQGDLGRVTVSVPALRLQETRFFGPAWFPIWDSDQEFQGEVEMAIGLDASPAASRLGRYLQRRSSALWWLIVAMASVVFVQRRELKSSASAGLRWWSQHYLVHASEQRKARQDVLMRGPAATEALHDDPVEVEDLFAAWAAADGAPTTLELTELLDDDVTAVTAESSGRAAAAEGQEDGAVNAAASDAEGEEFKAHAAAAAHDPPSAEWQRAAGDRPISVHKPDEHALGSVAEQLNPGGGSVWAAAAGEQEDGATPTAKNVEEIEPTVHAAVAARDSLSVEWRTAAGVRRTSSVHQRFEQAMGVAVELLNNGEAAAAILAAQHAAALDPSSSAAHELLGRAHRAVGAISAALEACRAAEALDPASASAAACEGLALAAGGDADGCAAALTRARSLRPSDSRIAAQLGAALLAVGRVDDAVEALEAAVRGSGGGATALYNLGVALGQRGDYDKARAAYRGALAVQPDYSAARVNLGVELLRAGDVEAAAAEFRSAAAAMALASPSGEKESGVAMAAAATAHANAAAVLERAGRLEEAAREYEAAAELTSASREGEASAALLLRLARLQRRSGQEEEALATLERATVLLGEEKRVEAQIEKALALQALGRHEAAASCFSVVVEQDAGSHAAHLGLGQSLIALEKAGAALQPLGVAVALRPGHDATLSSMQQALAMLGHMPHLAAAETSVKSGSRWTTTSTPSQEASALSLEQGKGSVIGGGAAAAQTPSMAAATAAAAAAAAPITSGDRKVVEDDAPLDASASSAKTAELEESPANGDRRSSGGIGWHGRSRPPERLFRRPVELKDAATAKEEEGTLEEPSVGQGSKGEVAAAAADGGDVESAQGSAGEDASSEEAQPQLEEDFDLRVQASFSLAEPESAAPAVDELKRVSAAQPAAAAPAAEEPVAGAVEQETLPVDVHDKGGAPAVAGALQSGDDALIEDGSEGREHPVQTESTQASEPPDLAAERRASSDAAADLGQGAESLTTPAVAADSDASVGETATLADEAAHEQSPSLPTALEAKGVEKEACAVPNAQPGGPQAASGEAAAAAGAASSGVANEPPASTAAAAAAAQPASPSDIKAAASYVAAGLSYTKMGKTDTAAKQFQKALARHPDWYAPSYHLASAALAGGNVARAAGLAVTALTAAVGPEGATDESALLDLGLRVFTALLEKDASAPELTQLAALLAMPGRYSASAVDELGLRTLRSIAAASQDVADTAVAALKSAAAAQEQQQKAGAAEARLGVLLMAKGEAALSATHLKAAALALPQDAQVFVLWGDALLASGHAADAEAQYSKAVALDASLGAAYRGLGMARRAAGSDNGAARSALAKAVSLGVKDAETMAALHELEESAATTSKEPRREPDTVAVEQELPRREPSLKRHGGIFGARRPLHREAAPPYTPPAAAEDDDLLKNFDLDAFDGLGLDGLEELRRKYAVSVADGASEAEPAAAEQQEEPKRGPWKKLWQGAKGVLERVMGDDSD